MQTKFTFAVLSFLTSLAFAGEYTYTVKNYATQPDGCHATAARLGEAFKLGTGITPAKSRCIDESKTNGYTLEVSYSTEQPLNLVSTSKVFAATSFAGRYTDRAKCEAAAPDEAAIFQEETGLRPILNVCVKDGISSDKWSWYPRIDAFGDAKKKPQMSGYQFFGVPQGMTGVQLREKVFASLKARGIRAVAMVFRSHMAYGDAAVHYYAPERIQLTMVEFTRTDRVEFCLAQDAEMDGIFNGDPNPPLVHYCGKPVLGAASELNVLFMGEPTVQARPSAEQFDKHVECEKARPALVKYYQENLKLPVRAGFCSRQISNEYRVMLIEDVSN